MTTSTTPPSIGIIGSGSIGTALARSLARAGLTATLANRRGPASLAPLLAELGAGFKAGSVADAAAQAIVVVAVPWAQLPVALAGLPDFGGRIVIDANNAVDGQTMRAVDLEGRTSSEIFGGFVPGARVVKAFNHLMARMLASDPAAEGGRRVLFQAGDDAAAKAEVGALIERLGFAAVDLGGLAAGGRLTQFPGGPLPLLNLVKFG